MIAILVLLLKDITFDSIPLVELLIIPNNYTTFLPTIKPIPISWSLGLEFHFYLLLPFLLKIRDNTKILLVLILFIAQFVVFNLAGSLNDYLITKSFCSGDLINHTYICSANISQIFGYTLMPIPFMYFILGSLLYSNKKLFDKLFPIYIVLTFFSYILGADTGSLNNYLVDDIYIGVIILFPVAYILLNSGKNIKFDRFIGGLAYPLFLVHYPVIWITRDLLEFEYLFISTLMLSLIFSYLLSLLQKIIDKYRYSLRGFEMTKPLQ